MEKGIVAKVLVFKLKIDEIIEVKCSYIELFFRKTFFTVIFD